MDTSLTAFVENNKSQITVQTKMSILYDVSKGLDFLHNHKPQIPHRDLSSTPIHVFPFGGIALHVFSEVWPTPSGQKWWILLYTEELVALSEAKWC